MAEACKKLANSSHVFPWVRELIFSTVKCLVLRSESDENVITPAQNQQNRYGNEVCNVLPYTYVHCWFRYHIYVLNALSWII